MNILIRNETPTDVNVIHSVIIQAFKNVQYSNHTEQFIVKALRANNALTISLVAEIDNTVIGHVVVSPVSISSGVTDWFGLVPIAVLPEYQGQGIGSMLINKSLDKLKQINAAGCVLLGEPAYYGRFGFMGNTSLILPDVPTEYFQANAFSGEIPIGYVKYHNAFNAND